uniref:Uncharacterized protein n=1 Tax=Anabas testudineus TaxID=64144 RepID=A0A7N6B8I9_ANATE
DKYPLLFLSLFYMIISFPYDSTGLYLNCFLFLSRLAKDTAHFKDELDTMKFICKDFWTCVFKKQIDNLRTNHQVIYCTLNKHMRHNTGMYPEILTYHMTDDCLSLCSTLTCGLIIVTAEVSVLPACKAHIAQIRCQQ